jgi:hypothetical protein
MFPPRCWVSGLLTVAVVAHTLRNMTSLSNAPIQVAPAASGTTKIFHATVTPDIPQRESGTARMRLASIREEGVKCSRGKTTLTDT